MLFLSFEIQAQHLRPFGGVTVYLDNNFDHSLIDGRAGVEFGINRFVLPEIELSLLLGSAHDISKTNENGLLQSIFTSKVSAMNFSFCPKIGLGNNGEGDSYLVILPRFSVSKIMAEGKFVQRNKSDLSKPINEREKITEWKHSLGIGVGFDVSLSDKNYNSIAFNLYYDGVDVGSTLSSLKHSGIPFNTKEIFGLGINYYFGLRKKMD